MYLDREDDFAYRLRYLAAVLEKLEENETGTSPLGCRGQRPVYSRIRDLFGKSRRNT